MEGILVIAHGSRAKETEASLDAVIAMVRTKLPEACIECAFMEFSDRTVERGVEALIGRGVTGIRIIPYFLFMGIHLQQDIPRLVAECAAKFPDVGITMAPPLDIDERLADIVVDRITR